MVISINEQNNMIKASEQNKTANTIQAYNSQCAMEVAIRENNFEDMVNCINNGASVNGFGDLSITPLMWAAYYGRVDMMMWLCDQGADIEAVSWGGFTALTDAVVKGYPEAVLMLLNRGANRHVLTTSDEPLTGLTKNSKILDMLNMEQE